MESWNVVDKLSDRSYVVARYSSFLKPSCNLPPVETTAYELGQDEASEVKEGASEVHVPVPDMEDQAQASTQKLTGKNGVHDQGR